MGTGANYPWTPNRSTAPDTTLASHAASGRRRLTSPSPTWSGTQTAGPGSASGGPIDRPWRSSGRRMATGVTELHAGDTLAAFGHHHSSATQVDAATVTAGGSHITTLDLSGFRESAERTHMSQRGARLPMRWKTQGTGNALERCPGAARRVVSGTCLPRRKAKSVDQRVLATVGQ